ncbi:hypothetical protein CR162_17830 [Pseudoroseomonas rhizosphaerae]|uniref:RNA-binding protein n=1 Tax=Teichococcus rhizosphaerae TaxID=1335062 RepID=A0A2C7A7J1_9PROT|nr:DUF721 domain-containing protein [Pseudoroseomonas rhizosphaerae]PHK93593.1 hypothetical protein CR162_17830 [Pseudoroseomonas rhizosphaerae]
MQQDDEAPRGSSPFRRKDEAGRDEPPGWRADRGPRPLSTLLPKLTRPVFRRRSPAATHLMTDWPEIVGPVLAAQTMPQKLVGGTLTLGCAGPMAMELQYLAPQLIERVNGALGQRVVERLKFLQMKMPPPARKAPKPPPVALPQPVSAALEEVADPELRAALARLGQGVYRGRKRR